ncbi:MAG: YHYH protein [Bacteroidia bacterium]
MRKILFMFLMLPLLGMSQAVINSWSLNSNGQLASYWLPSGNPPNATYTYVPTTDSASVLKVCYSTDSVWVYSHGMVYNMGKYANPGACSSKVYIYRFPRNPQVPTTKTICPKVGAIGCLVNGIPMYGLGDSKSWNGSTNANMGPGIWNVEVYMGEGVSLDTALSAHPQQQGAYHSHAKPRRLYQNTPVTQHSPIIGFAFDGYPVYGPYGYSSPLNSASVIARMKTGYSLRNITTRTMLPYGVTASQAGPPVSGTYPIGTYCEDYEWLSSNGGDLDKYNGRFCVTPEYPGGTYAYFTTIDASTTPQFPYYIGIEYYGAPDTKCAGSGTSTGLQFPVSGTSCMFPTNIDEMPKDFAFKVYPNPSNGTFTIKIEDDTNTGLIRSLEVRNTLGQVVYTSPVSSEKTDIVFPPAVGKGIYFVRILGGQSQVYATDKLIIE